MFAEHDFGVDDALAFNRSTPEGVLAQLAANTNATLRMRVAQNPSCPPDVRADLADDPDPAVREAARQPLR